jgi:hypothetical protein
MVVEDASGGMGCAVKSKLFSRSPIGTVVFVPKSLATFAAKVVNPGSGFHALNTVVF